MDAARCVRAVRCAKVLSQRELAARAGLPTSTVSRIEAGTADPKLSTFARLLDSVGFRAQIVDARGRLLVVKDDYEGLMDRSGRNFPAHLECGETPDYWDFSGRRWWGWHNIAWPGQIDRVPPYTYWRRRELFYRTGRDQDLYDWGRVWDDAT